MSYKFYIFDFDGVLFDTSRECLVTAFSTIVNNKEVYKFAQQWTDDRPIPNAIEKSFLENRYLVGPPWHYAVLLQLISEDRVPLSTHDFLMECERKRTDYQNFTEEYFRVRTNRANDLDKWVVDIQSFDLVCRWFLSLVPNAKILSTRDPDSISTLFRKFYELPSIADYLLPRVGTLTKAEHLVNFAKAQKLLPSEVFFLDDYLEHALPAHKAGFASYLASWGYLGPNDLKDAELSGLPKLDFADIAKIYNIN